MNSNLRHLLVLALFVVTTVCGAPGRPAKGSAPPAEAEAGHAAPAEVPAAPGAGRHEGEAGGPGTNPLSIDPDLALFTLIIFVGLLIVLGKFAWRPIMEGLEKRERGIERLIAEAQQSAEQARQQLSAYEAKLAAATEEARQILVQARHEATASGEQIVAAARQVADTERQRALDDIQMAKQSAVEDIGRQAADVAFSLAGRILEREMKPDDHARLVSEALGQLPSRN